MRFAVILIVAACRSTDAASPDALVGDGAPDAFVDKAAPCTDMFGTDLVDGFHRVDATVLAVVPPGHPTCPFGNATHLILEVNVHGSTYRMVTAVESSIGDPVMALAERDAPLAGPPWEEGLHTGVPFDYVDTLGLHRLDFTPTPRPELVASVTAHLRLGARVSVFATVEDRVDSAHLIHRNGSDTDGAIVIDADTQPHYLLLRFDNQLF
jgi:hypothetical protein